MIEWQPFRTYACALLCTAQTLIDKENNDIQSLRLENTSMDDSSTSSSFDSIAHAYVNGF